MSNIPLRGSSISFGVGDHPEAAGKKVPFIMFISGDITVTIPFQPQEAQNIAQAMVNGIHAVAQAAIQANGSLIVPQMNIPKGLNGGKQ